MPKTYLVLFGQSSFYSISSRTASKAYIRLVNAWEKGTNFSESFLASLAYVSYINNIFLGESCLMEKRFKAQCSNFLKKWNVSVSFHFPVILFCMHTWAFLKKINIQRICPNTDWAHKTYLAFLFAKNGYNSTLGIEMSLLILSWNILISSVGLFLLL